MDTGDAWTKACLPSEEACLQKNRLKMHAQEMNLARDDLSQGGR
jgi:hypothetical protein